MTLTQLHRREFLALSGAAAASACATGWSQEKKPAEPVAFFLIGDTHYLARKDQPGELDPASQLVTSRLIDTLNRLPGTEIPAASGAAKVATPRGLIHAGDLIDSGDKTGPVLAEMQKREWQGFVEDFGLSGQEGKLRTPVYEIHGNHDGPRGEGLVPEGIKARNKRRPGLVNVSPNGLHYSWDWGPVHFINLGIVVGGGANTKHGRYNPLDSLPFLVEDLKKHADDPARPVVITHHVDMARYSGPCEEDTKGESGEWHPCDVRGYYEALARHNIVAILYGHTHVRNVFRWNGGRDMKAPQGIPVFNTDNAAHFHSKTQALLYFEIGERELVAREYATADAWESGAWTPQVWRTPVRA
jgi:predicted phosphodiesterase